MKEFNFHIPEIKLRFPICYNEDCREGTFRETVFVLKDDPEAEIMVVAVLDRDDNTFDKPIKLVFDGNAYPYKLNDEDLRRIVGDSKVKICLDRMKAIETLLRTERTVGGSY